MLKRHDPSLDPTCKAAPGRTLIALDPTGKTAERFNAGWLPRAYVLDEQGRIAYVQAPDVPDAQAPRAARRALQGTWLADANLEH